MDDTELKQSVAEILDVPPGDLQADTQLDSLPTYDSTARLSLIVCISDFGGRPIGFAEVGKLRCYADIVKLVQHNQENA